MLESEQEVEAIVNETAGDFGGGENPAAEDAQQEEIVVSIGDAPVEEPAEDEVHAPKWVKEVRKRNRELERELKETRRKLQETGAVKEPELGEKPTLAALDYDTGKYEQSLAAWYDRKRKADEKAAASRAEAERADSEWKGRLASYQQAKTTFKAQDFEDAESVVMDLLDQTQQGIIIHGAADSAMVIYALGKNEGEAKKLSAIKDPVRFAFAVAKLEATLKVSSRKPVTAPEGRIAGNSRPSGTVDSTLARLREEAARTGDYSKVTAYKNQKRS